MLASHLQSRLTNLLLTGLLYNCLFYLHGLNLTSMAANILIPGPVVEGMGHIQVLSTLSARLVELGHNVTLLSGSKKCTQKFAASNVSHIVYYRSPNCTVNQEVAQELAKVKFYEYTPQENMDIFLSMYRDMAADCRVLLSNIELLNRLKSAQFDLLIGDIITPCDIFIANLLDIPWIPVTANRQYIFISNFGYKIPAELAYVPQPFGMTSVTDDMTFYQRFQNTVFYFSLNFIVYPNFLREFEEIKQQHNIAPEMDIWELASTAEIWLCQTSVVLDYPGPGLPNYVPVGGLGVRTPGKLPKV